MPSLSESVTELIQDYFRYPEMYKLLPDEIYSKSSIKNKRIVSEFSYEQRVTSISASQILEPFMYSGCKDDLAYVKRIMQSSQALRDVYRILHEEVQLDENKILLYLSKLFKRFHTNQQSSIPIEEAGKIAKAFCHHILDEPYHIYLKIWIENIWMGDQSVAIYDDMLIRKPFPSDFNSEDGLHNSITCSAIIEKWWLKPTKESSTTYIIQLIHALQLYNFGAVAEAKQWIISDSPLDVERGTLGSELWPSYKYNIKPEESEAISRFLKLAIQLMPFFNWKNTEGIDKKRLPIYLAIERYGEALRNSTRKEEQMATIMSAFEALLVEGTDNNELAFKLGLRVSYLSKYFGESPIHVLGEMKKGYKIRSCYLHGSLLKKAEKEVLNTLVASCLNLLRRTILIFLSFNYSIEKEKIIAMIDHSLIDPQTDDAFKQHFIQSPLLQCAQGLASTDV